MSARRRSRKRALWAVALSFAAIAVAAAALGVAGGRLGFGASHSDRSSAFPHEITCREGTDVCTPGRSGGGRAFRLFQVGESAGNATVVGVGVDTGDGKQATPLLCARSGDVLACGSQPPSGERAFGLYVPD